jgi:hypothetical protein
VTVLLALAAGYALGARSGGRELAELRRSVMALYQTDEFADVVAAARAQVGAGLRSLATIVEGGGAMADDGPAPADLLSRVRRMVDPDH